MRCLLAALTAVATSGCLVEPNPVFQEGGGSADSGGPESTSESDSTLVDEGNDALGTTSTTGPDDDTTIDAGSDDESSSTGSGESDSGEPSGCNRIISDDFEDGTLDPMWSTLGSIPVMEREGGLEFELGTEVLFGGITHDNSWDLTDATVVVGFGAPAQLDEHQLFLHIEAPDDAFVITMLLQGPDLRFDVDVNSEDVFTEVIPYDQEAHRFLRISLAPSTVSLAVSSDGRAWDDRSDFAGALDFTNVRLFLTGGTWAPAEYGETMRYEFVEVCGP